MSYRAGRHALHLLLVDDNPADARLMQEALREVGMGTEVSVATGGEEALNALRAPAPGSSRPDLVLLDLHLGHESGWDVLENIKNDPALKSVPVIVLTSSQDPRDIDRAYQLFANCCLVKPDELDPYIATVRTLLMFWSEVARLPRSFQRGSSGSSRGV